MKASDQLRQNIRDLREDKHLTQAVMAERLGLSETGYAKIERGEVKLSIDRIQQIANVLEVSIAELIPFGGDGVIACNYSDFSNSSNFSLAVGNQALENEISLLKDRLLSKDEIIDSREREIEILKQQIQVLEKFIKALEKS